MSVAKFFPLGCCLIASWLAGCAEERSASIMRQRSLAVMGTSLDIKVYGRDAAALDRAIDAAIAEIRRVEDLMTDWRASPLTTLNESSGKGPQEVPPELAKIIARGRAVGEQTKGTFDLSYAGVGKLWSFKGANPTIPDAAAIQTALRNVDFRRVGVDPENSTVDLPTGMRIGLGGIAKGYGVDRAMQILMEDGIEHAIVNAGGDMKVLGQMAGKNWEVAIKHARERDRAIAVLHVSNTCVVTSGDYERFFERDGVRYHHIIDPRTGYPAKGCISATVVAPSAEHADALATAMCVLGPTEGLMLIESLPRIEAILIGMDGSVQASSGLRGSLK